MSTSIHRAIGYAMPWQDFFATTLLDLEVSPASCLGDELERHLDIEGYRGLKYTGHDTMWKILDDGLVTQRHSPAHLIAVVGNGDDQDHVIFFPNEAMKRKWYRFNDDMDWVFACNVQGNYPESIIEYIETSPPPFERYWMRTTGEPVGRIPWRGFSKSSAPTSSPGFPMCFDGGSSTVGCLISRAWVSCAPCVLCGGDERWGFCFYGVGVMNIAIFKHTSY